MSKKKKIRKVTAYADIGSHGWIFRFDSGPVSEYYPGLLQIYHKKITPDLKKITITYEVAL